MGPVEKKAALILASIAIAEGTFVVLGAWRAPLRYLAFLGFAPGRFGSPAGWAAAAAVVALFVALAARLPSVRCNLVRPSTLKLLGLAVAIAAGVLEELVFRKLLMDWLAGASHSNAVQIVVSGVAFGVAHGIWGLFGRRLRAAVGATLATGLLGVLLAGVYVLSGRSVAPCIAAHFLINALIEPGLVLAACRGEMGGAGARA